MPYTLANGTILPSVTEILKATETPKQKEQLRKWNLENPGARETAANRGNATHAAIASYLLQPLPRLPVHPGEIPFGKVAERNYYHALYHSHLSSLPEKARDYYKGILPWLMEVEQCYWAEQQVGGEHQFIWSSLGYAGRPDVICQADGQLILIDLKTSDRPYSKTYQGDGGAYAKFCQAATQLAAYHLAVEETLGIVPEKLIVLVAMPGRYQLLELNNRESLQAKKRWLQRLKQYQKIYGRLVV